MAWDQQRIVRVGHGEVNVANLLGSGVLVSPTHVVTARHVVEKVGVDVRDLWVSTEDFHSAATITSKSAIDIAVLCLKNQSQKQGAPLDFLRGRDTRAGESVSVQGFPKVTATNPSNQRWTPNGWAQSTSPMSRTLMVEVDVQPTDREGWGGMSGGAVIETECGAVLGIVSEMYPDWDGRLLRVVPSRMILQEPGLREALGVGSSQAAHAAAIDNLVARLTGELMPQDRVDLRARIAHELGLSSNSSGAVALANAMVRDESCATVTNVLNIVDDALREAKLVVLRRALHRVLRLFLPACVRWNEVAHALREQHQSGTKALRLSVCNATAAEAACAAAEGREARVILDKLHPATPRGAGALVNLARHVGTDTIVREDVLLHALLSALAETLKLEPDAHGRYSAVQVENRIQRLATAGPVGQRHTPYFLFLPTEVKEPDHFWEKLVQTASKHLPSLWTIRLDPEFRAADDNIAHDLAAMLRRAEEDHLES